MQKCFEYLRWTKGDLPETERASEETLALPIFPELETFEQETVVGRIAEFFGVSKRTPHEAKTPAATVRESDSNTCILPGRMPHVLSRTRSAGKADDVRS